MDACEMKAYLAQPEEGTENGSVGETADEEVPVTPNGEEAGDDNE